MVIDREKWKYIKDEYDNAKACLCSPDDGDGWSRDEDDGFAHLWNAYHEARECRDRDHLLYGRILYLMLTEMESNSPAASVFGKFLHLASPMKREYDLALEELVEIPEEEWDDVNERYSYLHSKMLSHGCTDEEYEYGISLIENNELLGDFQFHDSRITFFQIDGGRCILKLDYYGYVLTFEFLGVMGYQIDMPDIPCDYIYEYKCWDGRDFIDGSRYIFFDLEFMYVTCRSVRIIDVDKVNFHDPWKR